MNQFEALHLPTFCYGTLRPGGGNDSLWRSWEAEARHDGLVEAPGFTLLEKGLPYAVSTLVLREARPEEMEWARPVVGALIYPSADEWEARCLRQVLDGLEGHPDFYIRTPTRVTVEGGSTLAWIYVLAGIEWAFDPSYRINTSGDFMSTRARRVG